VHRLFSVTIHASDRQTDRQTDGWTEWTQQYHALHYMQSHGKNWQGTLLDSVIAAKLELDLCFRKKLKQ